VLSDDRQRVLDGDLAASSPLSEVTPASRMPHGTIRSYAVLSGLQLNEKPCMVTPLADPDADRGELAVLPALPALEGAYSGPSAAGELSLLVPLLGEEGPTSCFSRGRSPG